MVQLSLAGLFWSEPMHVWPLGQEPSLAHADQMVSVGVVVVPPQGVAQLLCSQVMMAWTSCSALALACAQVFMQV